MRGSVSWKITTCNCSRVAPSYGKICTAIGVRIWKRSPAWRERRDEMTSAMQAAAQDFTIPLQPIERSPAFAPLPPTPITAWWPGVVARHEGRIAVIANRGEPRYADSEGHSQSLAKGSAIGTTACRDRVGETR